MTEKEALQQMDIAIREDRERFFKIADTLHLQPKWADKAEELESLKQQWRDVTTQEGYPDVTHPLPLPDWFPAVNFASRFEGIADILDVSKKR
jgi:hypothetical protein